jgi:COMPASS (Complex proteins associated with Set1p) component shg1
MALSRARRPGTAGDGNAANEGDFVYKRPKISELPIASSQRNQIDELLHTFKRVGEFDKLRKQIYSQFMESVS